MRRMVLFAATCVVAGAQPRTVLLPGKSPLVDLRFAFLTGAADDPPGKEGIASLTASMLARGGSRTLSFEQISQRFFPMATQVSVQVDKHMTTFSAQTHIDNLDAFYAILRDMLLDPGWRPEDLTRLRDDQINALRTGIRGNNDEELGKEVLYNAIYAGHPYGHHNFGKVSSIGSITIEDMKAFRKARYTQANLILGLAGGYPPSFVKRVLADFGKLPAGKAARPDVPTPKKIDGMSLTIIDKPTRAAAISFGFPIDVRRGHPDYAALLVAQSYFGQHRSSAGQMYQRIRELRGLNYGDYAYLEYFPNGMFRFEPEPNLARPQQIFQVWIRPLELPTAHFGLRLALHELERLVREGLSEEAFERTRGFLSKYVSLLVKTKSAELGYAIDSAYYGIPAYPAYVREGLARLTRDSVNRAIRKHLDTGNMHVVLVAPEAEKWKRRLLANEPSPMKYNAPKPDAVLEEDKTVEKRPIPLREDRVTIIPVDRVFE